MSDILRQREARVLNNWIESAIGPPDGRVRRVNIVRPGDHVFLACLDESVDGCSGCPATIGRDSAIYSCLCACHRGQLANHSQTGGRR